MSDGLLCSTAQHSIQRYVGYIQQLEVLSRTRTVRRRSTVLVPSSCCWALSPWSRSSCMERGQSCRGIYPPTTRSGPATAPQSHRLRWKSNHRCSRNWSHTTHARSCDSPWYNGTVPCIITIMVYSNDNGWWCNGNLITNTLCIM